jgi:hypothetical protein
MRRSTPIIVAIVAIAIPIVAMIAWMSSRPTWQISAYNSPQGVVIEIYKSNAARPTYSTVLPGKTINTDIERASRMNLPEDLGQTTFHDETLRPGRWTLVIQETEIDIMERALIVDRATEVVPRD